MPIIYNVTNITNVLTASRLSNCAQMAQYLMNPFQKSTNVIIHSTWIAAIVWRRVRNIEPFMRTNLQHLIMPFYSLTLRPTEPPRPNEKCPRRNGFFAHPDPSNCQVFFNCIDGNAIENNCGAGLHFDEYTGTCLWPSQSERTGCVPPKSKHTDHHLCYLVLHL